MSEPPPPRRVLVFAPSSIGGIAEYVHHQAEELAGRGLEVEVLCKPDFARPSGTAGYRQLRRLRTVAGAGLVARIRRRLAEVLNYHLLAIEILRRRPDFVLMEANSEYAAPAWAWPHLLLAWSGVTYVANFHDPVRGAILGMRWYGSLCRLLAYGSLRGALLLDSPPPGAWLPRWLAREVAPHGLYAQPAQAASPRAARARRAIPDDAFVLLAFGHVADRKNLDLLVRALPAAPGVVLVIAGPPGAPRDRPAAFYRQLADRLGVGERLRIEPGFVADDEIPELFAAADAVALTYDAAFSSQSGVLHIAAAWDKPILASGGPGALRQTVERYRLGLFVSPDSLPALIEGIAAIRSFAARPEAFAAFRDQASWQRNVDRLLDLVARIRSRRR